MGHASGLQEIHDVGPAAESAQRQAAADGLGQADQIGRQAPGASDASGRQARPGFYLVQNEQRPLPPADFLMASKNPGLGGQMVTLSITGSAMTAAISPG